MFNILKKLISKAPFIESASGGKGGKVPFVSGGKVGGGIGFRIGMYLVGGLIIGGVIFFTGDYVAGTVLKLGNQTNQAPTIIQGIQGNLIGHWALNNITGRTDLSGYGHDATAGGATHLISFGSGVGHSGVAGGATTFDGIDDYITLPQAIVGNLETTSSFSISVWIYMNGDFADQSIIYQEDAQNGSRNIFRIQKSGANHNLAWDHYGPAGGAFGGPNLALNQWYYVTFVQKLGEYQKFFVNGVEGASRTSPWEIYDSLIGGAPTNFRIGTYFGFNYYWKGAMEDFRVYNKALTSMEIKALYNNSSIEGGKKLKLNNPASQTTVVPDGLVGYWKMDINPTTGVVTDSSSSNPLNHGTITGTTKPVAVPGQIGSALNFDGADDYIDLGSSQIFNFGSSNFTVSAKFKTSVVSIDSGAYRSFISFGGFDASSDGWKIAVRNDGVLETWWANAARTTGSGSVADGKWHTVTYKRDGNNFTFYLDAVQNGATSVFAGALGFTKVILGVGGMTGALQIASGRFNGSIDEVRIYNRALTQAEITTLYNDKPLGASVGNHETQAALPQFICGLTQGAVIPGRAPDVLMYGAVKGEDGRCWLDRNLGATRVATSADDTQAYGWLYQWGRGSDGHQYTLYSTPNYANSGTQSGQVATVTPGTNTFIIPSLDWSSIDSNGLIRQANWGVNGISNPCPVGFRVPTAAELTTFANASGLITDNCDGGVGEPTCQVKAFSTALKLPAPGLRNNSNGGYSGMGTNGVYLSSSLGGYGDYNLYFYEGHVLLPTNSGYFAYGFSVRCIKN